MKIKIAISLLFILIFSFAVFSQNSNTAAANAISNAVNSAANAVRRRPSAANAANTYYAEKPEPPKTKLTGKLFYEDTGKPLRRGKLSLSKMPEKKLDDDKYRYFDLESTSFVTITNDEGEFTLEDVTPGEYYPYIDVQGVLKPNSFNELYKKASEVSEEKLSAFFEKIVVNGTTKELQVLVRARRGGAIGGKILYSDGDPVIDAKVELLRNSEDGFESGSTEAFGTIKTDDRGFYRIAGIPSGEYVVRVIEPVSSNSERPIYYPRIIKSELKTYYGDTYDAKKAKIFQLSLGEEKAEIDITIPERKIFRISGTVVSKEGKPIPNARVTFEKDDESFFLSYLAIGSYDKTLETDEEGKWVFKNLLPGSYKLTVSPPPAYDYGQEESAKPIKLKKYAQNVKEIVISEKNVEDVVIQLPLESRISGSIEFDDKRSVEDLGISIFDEKSGLSGYASQGAINEKEGGSSSDKRWDFSINEVSPCTCEFFVHPGKPSNVFYIKSITLSGRDLLNSSLIVKEDETITGIKVILGSDLGILKGKVKIKGEDFGKPHRIILVSTTRPNSRSLVKSAKINENGEFEMKLGPDEYFVIVLPLPVIRESDVLRQAEWVEKFTKNAEKITIKAGETTTLNIKK